MEENKNECYYDEHNFVKVAEGDYDRRIEELSVVQREHYTRISMICTRCGKLIEVETQKYIKY